MVANNGLSGQDGIRIFSRLLQILYCSEGENWHPRRCHLCICILTSPEGPGKGATLGNGVIWDRQQEPQPAWPPLQWSFHSCCSGQKPFHPNARPLETKTWYPSTEDEEQVWPNVVRDSSPEMWRVLIMLSRVGKGSGVSKSGWERGAGGACYRTLIPWSWWSLSMRNHFPRLLTTRSPNTIIYSWRKEARWEHSPTGDSFLSPHSGTARGKPKSSQQFWKLWR